MNYRWTEGQFCRSLLSLHKGEELGVLPFLRNGRMVEDFLSSFTIMEGFGDLFFGTDSRLRSVGTAHFQIVQIRIIEIIAYSIDGQTVLTRRQAFQPHRGDSSFAHRVRVREMILVADVAGEALRACWPMDEAGATYFTSNPANRSVRSFGTVCNAGTAARCESHATDDRPVGLEGSSASAHLRGPFGLFRLLPLCSGCVE
jgi:hypothetical protein